MRSPHFSGRKQPNTTHFHHKVNIQPQNKMIAQRFFTLAIIVAVAAVANADPRLRAAADLVISAEEVSETTWSLICP